jgi:cytochrome c oxidase subunit III
VSRPALDVSKLPDYAFGHQGLIWWGTAGFMVIEGTMFLVTMMALLVLRARNEAWPPGAPNPDLGPATINTVILLASAIPNHLAKKAGEQMDVGQVKPWLLATIGLGVVFLIVRAFEFPALNVRWDEDAYGSIVWFILGLHTTHVATDVVDSAVLLALLFTKEVRPRRFVDVSENALYWDFIILSWLPLYALLYWFPRWS